MLEHDANTPDRKIAFGITSSPVANALAGLAVAMGIGRFAFPLDGDECRVHAATKGKRGHAAGAVSTLTAHVLPAQCAAPVSSR